MTNKLTDALQAESELKLLKQEIAILREHLNMEIKRRELLEEKVSRIEQKESHENVLRHSFIHSNTDSNNQVSEFI